MNPAGDRMRMKRTVGPGGPLGIEQPRQTMFGPLDIGAGARRSAQPPNLRDADDEMNCGECRHFTGEGCSKFNNYPVEADQVCDQFEGKGEEMGEGMGDQASDPYEMEA